MPVPHHPIFVVLLSSLPVIAALIRQHLTMRTFNPYTWQKPPVDSKVTHSHMLDEPSTNNLLRQRSTTEDLQQLIRGKTPSMRSGFQFKSFPSDLGFFSLRHTGEQAKKEKTVATE